MIKDEEISVVVQGPIYQSTIAKEQYTRMCCDSIKKVMPNCELILSTWEGSNVDGIKYDKIIFSKDPGGIEMILYGKNKMNNTNRMVLSTKKGIDACTRKYCLKMRSDMFIKSNKFLKAFEKYPDTEDSFLKHRILSLSANYWKRAKNNFIFTISDWFQFGYKEDIEKLWCHSIQNLDELVSRDGKLYFEDNLVAEAYIYVNFLLKNEKYSRFLKNDSGAISLTEENIEVYKTTLAKYFIIYTGKELKLNSYKLKNMNYVRRDFARASCFTHYDWIKLYNKYCNKSKMTLFMFRDKIDILLYRFTFNFLRIRFKGLYNLFKKIGGHR